MNHFPRSCLVPAPAFQLAAAAMLVHSKPHLQILSHRKFSSQQSVIIIIIMRLWDTPNMVAVQPSKIAVQPQGAANFASTAGHR